MVAEPGVAQAAGGIDLASADDFDHGAFGGEIIERVEGATIEAPPDFAPGSQGEDLNSGKG